MICGGAGAGPGFYGTSAIHSQLINTRTTDPEVLELRYPVRLEAFAVRRGFGGADSRSWKISHLALPTVAFSAFFSVSLEVSN